MARINLSVPDELKEQMDAIDTNWSAIAVREFQNTVSLYRLKGNLDMNAVAQRLSASKQRYEKELKAEGMEAGREWAAETAEYEHLKRLENCNYHLESWVDFAQLVSDNDRMDRYELDALAEQFFGDEHNSVTKKLDRTGFIESFVSGALEIFGEAKKSM